MVVAFDGMRIHLYHSILCLVWYLNFVFGFVMYVYLRVGFDKMFCMCTTILVGFDKMCINATPASAPAHSPLTTCEIFNPENQQVLFYIMDIILYFIILYFILWTCFSVFNTLIQGRLGM